jgi:hypothetical protein
VEQLVVRMATDRTAAEYLAKGARRNLEVLTSFEGMTLPVTASWDDTARVWNAAAGQRVTAEPSRAAVPTSSCGSRMPTGA